MDVFNMSSKKIVTLLKLIAQGELLHQLIDRLVDFYLGVKTCKAERLLENRSIHYAYEPTHYWHLKEMFTKYPFNEDDHFVDFGCGKGRVILVSAYLGCPQVTGVDINPRMIDIASKNMNTLKTKNLGTTNYKLICCDARNFSIDDNYNKFFFFNPFHLKVFIHVINKIVNSLHNNNRKIVLFLYYPTTAVLQYLSNIKEFDTKQMDDYPMIFIAESRATPKFYL